MQKMVCARTCSGPTQTHDISACTAAILLKGHSRFIIIHVHHCYDGN